MPSKLTHRMTAQDAAFLYLERAHAPLHIGSLGVYEGQIPFDRFVKHIESRLPNIPRYRQRVLFVPFGIAHPTWEDDPEFDVRRQIFFSELPAPGTFQQLKELSVEIFKQQLERNKPLWEMHIIHGIEGDRSAILTKVHHCMVDGVSGIDLLMAVVDITQEPAPPPEPDNWQPKPLPTTSSQLADAFWDNLETQREMWQEIGESILDPRSRIRRSQDAARSMTNASPWMSRPAPRTPFTTKLDGDRHVAFSEVSFPEIREIRTALGGTVNDVVLAVITGALRGYLETRGYDVSGEEPRVAVPVNIRMEDEEGALGNRISVMLTPLPIGEADPAKRLDAVRSRLDLLKAENQAGAMESFSRLASYAPANWHAFAGSLPPSNTVVNMICTNVPGPMIPLYTIGHLLLAHYPLVPLSMDMGVGIGVTTYNQKLFFGVMANPKAVPDIERLGQFIEDSYLALREAAGVQPSDVPEIGGHSTNGVAEHANVAAAPQVAG